MLAIPEINDVQIVFGDIGHMPDVKKIPPEFDDDHNKYNRFIANWLYKGISPDQIKEKEGVDRHKALRAIAAIMKSYAPKHEHKMMACAYMLSEWFDIVKESK